MLYVISKKVKEPDFNMKVSYGPLFKMNIVGFERKIIGVYSSEPHGPVPEYCQSLRLMKINLASSGVKV